MAVIASKRLGFKMKDLITVSITPIPIIGGKECTNRQTTPLKSLEKLRTRLLKNLRILNQPSAVKMKGTLQYRHTKFEVKYLRPTGSTPY